LTFNRAESAGFRYEAVRTGKVTLREAKPKPAKPTKQDLRARYSDKEFFNRIGRMLAGTIVKHPLLDLNYAGDLEAT
jgi:hypothetical protein